MTDTMIEITGLKKEYRLYDTPASRVREVFSITGKKYSRQFLALDGISMDVKKGETVGIIGTNGAGKSTLLKIITGVLSPTEGSVAVNGKIAALLELGAGFNQEYTGLQNIYLNGRIMGYTKKQMDERVQSIIDFAEIGDFIHQPVKTYSSGMFVRLAFAVAINIDPEILIVDEALSVGDVFFQAKCYRKFEEFKKEGKTILFVSHDLGSVSKYCDRVVLLNQGVKRAEGSAKEMVDLYKKLLVGQDGDEKEAAEQKEMPDPAEKSTSSWERSFALNPQVLEYGNKDGEIVDFTIRDENNVVTNTIEKGTDFTIHMRIKFSNRVESPIFAYSIKDLKGTEITGTNTMYEEADVKPQNPGDVVEVSFRQNMSLQGGEYLLSLGCTGYKDGDFQVFHRLYDVCSITVLSTKNTVGFYDMNSKVEVH